MKEIVKRHSGLIGIVLGLCVATIVHAFIEVPVLIWAIRGGAWNPFLWFNTYSQFAYFDKILAVIQWTLGIVLGYYLGKKYLLRIK